MKKITLLLLRHGETDAAKEGRLLGSTDQPLSDSTLQRRVNLQQKLSHWPIDTWFCSPMLRTRQTAEYLRSFFPELDDPVFDSRLCEIDFGRWELKTFTEIQEEDPDLIAEWEEYSHFTFPGGESIAAFCERLTAVLGSLHFGDSAKDKKNILLVTHGGVIRTMICLALGLDAKNYLLFDVQPSGLCVLDLYSEGAVLRALNL